MFSEKMIPVLLFFLHPLFLFGSGEEETLPTRSLTQRVEISGHFSGDLSVKSLPLYKGFTWAVTSRWDDNCDGADATMADLLDKYGYKGTFYLMTTGIGKELEQSLLRRGHPLEPWFSQLAGNEDLRKREPNLTLCTHAWAYAVGPKWPLLETMLKAHAGRKDHWYCTQADYGAYRYQYRRAKITKLVKTASGISFNLVRPLPIDAGRAVPGLSGREVARITKEKPLADTINLTWPDRSLKLLGGRSMFTAQVDFSHENRQYRLYVVRFKTLKPSDAPRNYPMGNFALLGPVPQEEIANGDLFKKVAANPSATFTLAGGKPFSWQSHPHLGERIFPLAEGLTQHRKAD